MPDQLLKVAFWNVENLFDPDHNVDRGPQSNTELNAKLDRLSECINGFFNQGTDAPELIALVEINTLSLFRQLKDRLSGQYLEIWEPPGRTDQTGLGILAKEPIIDLEYMDAQRVTLLSRPRCLIVRCLLPLNRSFLVVINHWKSQMKTYTAGLSPDQDRKQTARWIRDTLSLLDETCVLLLGDFNAEPTESYFNDDYLRCTYHFSKANYRAAELNRFYNTSWRFLTEPFHWEDWHSKSPKPQEPRSKRTHSGSMVVWDQLLVSGYTLKNGPIQLQEKTVDLYKGPLNAKHNKNGVLVPVRWEYNQGNPKGASDHFPVLAEFEML